MGIVVRDFETIPQSFSLWKSRIKRAFTLFSCSSSTSVDWHGGRGTDLFDESTGFQVLHGLTGQISVNLETIDQDGGGNQLVSSCFLDQLVSSGLVEEDGVV